ncbi:hypothetical protein ACSVIA_20385 [Rhodococcus erythropolis]|uniref:hypothetical protein n=1 Tax=Rhodococcus erythropolis TaxID=1833 RepID=UPI004041DF98
MTAPDPGLTEMCQYCGETIEPFGSGPTQWVHTSGPQERKNTCALNPYGKYHAEPEDRYDSELSACRDIYCPGCEMDFPATFEHVADYNNVWTDEDEEQR